MKQQISRLMRKKVPSKIACRSVCVVLPESYSVKYGHINLLTDSAAFGSDCAKADLEIHSPHMSETAFDCNGSQISIRYAYIGCILFYVKRSKSKLSSVPRIRFELHR